MTRRPYLVALAAAAFVVGLVYVTLRSASDPADLSREDRAAVLRTCQEAIREEIPDARFPFEPAVTAAPDGGVRLAGSVDSGDGITATRRNYECQVSTGSSSGGFRADSVRVWQSH